ncbi:MAG: biopolymer transporter ExbD [Bacteroides sp.]|nr:biopolymer transporter ExbD [Roseburia sp.]MCM1347388.1 biopolymer transporter ExbD [Bacteroides sp.]MCM1419847.1 biopolymer transporter ExbD [Bacteroides sp.]
MSLHRRTKVTPTFNMSSMTDIVFLLLIFFMITSTMLSPNAIKVLLPQGKKQTTVKAVSHVVIDKDLNIYASVQKGKEQLVTLEELPSVLGEAVNDTTDLFVSLYADESVPYKNIVEVLNVANENHFKMVLATRPPKK